MARRTGVHSLEVQIVSNIWDGEGGSRARHSSEMWWVSEGS